MQFNVFYNIEKIEEEVSEDSPVEMDMGALLPLIDEMREDGDFLGLLDGEGNLLQLMYDWEADAFWVEIPDEERQGSHGAVYLRDELETFLGSIKPVFKTEDFPIFEFVEWEDEEGDAE